MEAPGNEWFESSFGRAMLQITKGGTINLEGLRLAGEAEDPQSVRPQGAENYPEPCPREKGTERRFVRERGIWASWRMIGVGGSLGRCERVTARRAAERESGSTTGGRSLEPVARSAPAMCRGRQITVAGKRGTGSAKAEPFYKHGKSAMLILPDRAFLPLVFAASDSAL